MKYLPKTTEYLIYLLALTLPLQTRWIIMPGFNEYATYSLYGTDILILAIVIMHSFLFLLCSKRQVDTAFWELGIGNWKLRSVWYLIAGLDLFIFISIWFAPDKSLALFRYGWFLLGVGLLWVLISAEYDRIKFIYAFLAGLGFQAALGIYQFLAQSSFASKWLGMAAHDPAVPGVSVVEAGGRWLRAYGGQDHPNILGGLLVVGIFLLANSKIQETRYKQNQNQNKESFLLSTFYFLLLTVLFFTFSRSAWLGLSVAFLLSCFLAFLKKDWQTLKRLSTYAFAGAALIAVLTFFYKDLVFTRLSGEGRLEAKSTSERMASYGEAWQIIKAHPVFGVGIGNYTLALRDLKPGEPAYYYQPVHNTFLLVWAEIGIFGLLFLIALMLCVMCYVLRGDKYLAIGLVFAMIIMMMFDHWWWSLHGGGVVFWLIINNILYERKNNIR